MLFVVVLHNFLLADINIEGVVDYGNIIAASENILVKGDSNSSSKVNCVTSDNPCFETSGSFNMKIQGITISLVEQDKVGIQHSSSGTLTVDDSTISSSNPANTRSVSAVILHELAGFATFTNVLFENINKTNNGSVIYGIVSTSFIFILYLCFFF
jgi:hypothetical protein